MKIDRTNYEAWFLDYIEGELSPEMQKEVETFLLENPDLAAELSGFDELRLEPGDYPVMDKESILRSKYDDEQELVLASADYHSQKMNSDEEAELLQWLSTRPEKRKYFDSIGNTILKPYQEVRFPDKNSLRRRPVKKLLYWSAAAAGILFAVLLFRPENPYHEQTVSPHMISEIDTPDEIIEEERDLVAEGPSEIPDQIETARKEESPVISSKPQVLPEKKVMIDPAASVRRDSVIPEALQSREILLARADTEIELVPIPSIAVREGDRDDFREQLADHLEEIRSGDREFLTSGVITKSGLKLIASIAGKRWKEQRNENGELESVSFDSKLLGLSIPVDRED